MLEVHVCQEGDSSTPVLRYKATDFSIYSCFLFSGGPQAYRQPPSTLWIIYPEDRWWCRAPIVVTASAEEAAEAHAALPSFKIANLPVQGDIAQPEDVALWQEAPEFYVAFCKTFARMQNAVQTGYQRTKIGRQLQTIVLDGIPVARDAMFNDRDLSGMINCGAMSLTDAFIYAFARDNQALFQKEAS